MQTIENISILGAGAFGTALALSFAPFKNISLFSAFDEHVRAMQNSRINGFFPKYPIPQNVSIDNIKNLFLHRTDCIFWVFPVAPSIEILEPIQMLLDGLPIVICSKGLGSQGEFLSDLFQYHLPHSDIFCLAGPNFAHELAERKLSMANIMCKSEEKAQYMASQLHNSDLKLIAGKDPIGLQIFGAIKNIIAIASGILAGLKCGQNTSTALISMACKEMQTLALTLGAAPDTILSPCGIGDLVLTASSANSRNFKFGLELAHRNFDSPQEILNNSTAVCEGFYSTKSINILSSSINIDLPICKTIFKIIYEHAPADEILKVFA